MRDASALLNASLSSESAVRLLDVERMGWTIAGDLSKIEPHLTGLDPGDRQMLSPDSEALYG